MIKFESGPKNIPFYWELFINQIRQNWHIGTLEIEIPKYGTTIIKGKEESEKPQSAHLKINNFRAIRRILFSGDIGLFEGYKNGDWETKDLYAFFKYYHVKP